MKITHFNNSFISVHSGENGIAFDPWVGKANASGWQSYPEFSYESIRQHLAEIRWIYISHLHDDHFHAETLTKCGLLDREFIIKRFSSPVLKERLLRLGVKQIHEVDPFGLPQMSSNSSNLQDDVSYDLDTSVVVKAEDVVFFNQVDNPMSMKDLFDVHGYIVRNFGEVDVACIMSGAASEYPHLFLDIDHLAEKRSIVQRALFDLSEWLKLLSPRYYFPAGGTYLIPGWMSQFNSNIAQPSFSEIQEYLSLKNPDVQSVFLEGGGYIDVYEGGAEALCGKALLPVTENRQAAIDTHRMDLYSYEEINSPDWSVLLPLLDLARKNWSDRVQEQKLRISQSIRFDIYLGLAVDGEGVDLTRLINKYQLYHVDDTCANAGDLVVHIDVRALFGCVTRQLVWNGVLGALCLYERNPNRHYPTDFFSLNFWTLSFAQMQSVGAMKP